MDDQAASDKHDASSRPSSSTFAGGPEPVFVQFEPVDEAADAFVAFLLCAGAFVFFAVMAIALKQEFDQEFRSRPWSVFFVSVAFASLGVAVLVLGLGVYAFGRRHMTHRPLLKLDRDGLECAQGSVRWGEVERVVELLRRDVISSLLFLLRPGAGPRPPTGRYSGRPSRLRRWIGNEYWRDNSSSFGLEVMHSACRRQALDAIHRFYAGPVTPVRVEDLEAELDNSAMDGGPR